MANNRACPLSLSESNIQVITVDIFGTLFDVTDLISRTADTLVKNQHLPVSPATFCHIWTKHIFKWRWHTAAFQSMRQWHKMSFEDTKKTLRISLDIQKALTTLFAGMANAPLYPEASGFMTALSKNYSVYLVSNIDTDLMRRLIKTHKLPVKGAVSSEMTQSYKPHQRIFDYARGLSGMPEKQILHIGDELLYDVRGASRAGFFSAWINRKNETLKRGYAPHFQANNLRDLWEILKSGV